MVQRGVNGEREDRNNSFPTFFYMERKILSGPCPNLSQIGFGPNLTILVYAQSFSEKLPQTFGANS